MPAARQITRIETEKMFMYGKIVKTPNAPPAIALKIATCFNNNSLIIIYVPYTVVNSLHFLV